MRDVSQGEPGLEKAGWYHKGPIQPPAQLMAGSLPALLALEWEKGDLQPSEAQRLLGARNPEFWAQLCMALYTDLPFTRYQFSHLYPGPSLRASPAWVIWTLMGDPQAKEEAEVGRITEGPNGSQPKGMGQVGQGLGYSHSRKNQ